MFLTRYVSRILPVSTIVQREFRGQEFHGMNERAIEYSFVFRQIAARSPRTILDVGTGTTALPHLMRSCGSVVTAIDNIRDFWPMGMTNRHFHVIDDDITRTTLRQSFDMITCISVLEHIHDFDLAVRNMASLLGPNGCLIITCPYSDSTFIPNVYTVPGSDAFGRKIPYVARSYARTNIDSWCETNRLELLEEEFWRCWTGDMWSHGEKIVPPVRSSASSPHNLGLFVFQKTA